MWWIRGVVFGIFVVLGCATISHDVPPPEADLLPPDFKITSARDRQDLDYFFLKMADSQKRPAVKWWVDYRRAKLWQEDDPRLACDLYSRLGQDLKFPLHLLAQVRSHMVCGSADDLEALLVPTWMQSVKREAQLGQARARGDQGREFDLLIEKSKESAIPEEKLALVESALQIATGLKDSSREALALERREKISPRFLRQPTPSQWLAMAHDFRRARDFAQAKTFYQKVIAKKNLAARDKLSAWKGLAQTYKTEHNTAAYLEALAKIVRMTKPSKDTKSQPAWRLHHDAIVNLSRANWTDGRLGVAEKLVRDATIKFKGRISRAELFWLLGRMSEEKNELEAAVDWFQKARSEVDKKSDLNEKLNWYLAWNQRKLAKWPEAIASFSSARDEAINDFSKARFSYWLARTYRDGKIDEQAAEKVLQDLTQEDPLGYYGLLAQYDLGRNIKLVAKPVAAKSPSHIRDLIDLTAFDWLVALEERDLARQMLDEAATALRKQDDQARDESTWTDLLRAYAQTGSYLQLYERLGRMPADQRQTILIHHPELLFPQPWQSEVHAAAQKVALPPELLFAIMRQESSFNPRARSPADAFGLMQLLPEIAERSARSLDVQFRKPEDLFEPEINIPIGAHHMRELWDRFNGQFIPAVASYNASEKSIRGWLKNRFHGSAVEFIEEVPYEETRGYIRLVMRNLIFYQLINSPKGEIEFPAWVLKVSPEP